MTRPSSPPAPMTAEDQQAIERLHEWVNWSGPRAAIADKTIERAYAALTAREATLEREQQYTCEQHRDEVRKGGRCVWCELAAARGAFDLSESERQRLAGRINAIESELAAARKELEIESDEPTQTIIDGAAQLDALYPARKVEDGKTVAIIEKLINHNDAFLACGRDFSDVLLDAASELTRLSAALKEAERDIARYRDSGAKLLAERGGEVVKAEARAQAAEAQLKEVRKHSREAYDHLCSNAIESVRRSRAMELLRLVIAQSTSPSSAPLSRKVIAMTDKSAREILREWSFVERCGHYPHTEVEKPCPHCDGTAQTILVALEAGGFVVVPKEPTEEMHNAARDWSAWKYGKPIGIDASDGCYKAMLAASNPKEEGSDN